MALKDLILSPLILLAYPGLNNPIIKSPQHLQGDEPLLHFSFAKFLANPYQWPMANGFTGDLIPDDQKQGISYYQSVSD